jgi:hypothetical protein|tara:strand:- start:19205 stop:19402 length:198 start_codon:yes stop_codon:yes gene_type:complete
MSKLINEDWEHAAYANDKMYQAEREHLIELGVQEKEPAIIIVQKPNKDENAHKPKRVQRTHQEKL